MILLASDLLFSRNWVGQLPGHKSNPDQLEPGEEEDGIHENGEPFFAETTVQIHPYPYAHITQG